MYRLFEFFYQYRAFLFFVLLETISIWLLVNNNNYQGAAFFNSSNQYIGNVLEVKSNIQSYFELKQVNRELAEENAKLREQLLFQDPNKKAYPADTSIFPQAKVYYFIPARVINNSVAHFTNYITINKGKQDGLKEGMGLVCNQGIVGRIRECSDHYCTAFSFLHDEMMISGKVRNKDRFVECNIKWERKSPNEGVLLDVPRHEKIAVGDSVMTSGYNTYFPEGIMIGKIKEFKMEGGSFWKATIELSTDFTSLSYVYAIGNKYGAEKDSLESKNPMNHEK